jgi:Arc/MetJ-type ribon-helix-helix transcriptional regulator
VFPLHSSPNFEKTLKKKKTQTFQVMSHAQKRGCVGDITSAAGVQILPTALIVFPMFAVGERFNCLVNSIVYSDSMTQVQLRLSQKTLEEIDRWVAEGRFKSRSDAIRTIVSFYEEREKTREFFRMLMTRSEEAKKHPEAFIPLEEL